MARACWAFRSQYITPMAAVAGAVADTILTAMLAAEPRLERAYVNNGGDIAFHLTPGEAADGKSYDTLIDLPEQKAAALLADRAYDADAIIADLKQRGIKPVIPPKSNRTAKIRYSKRLYRQT